jgi:hypothetical protein
MIIKTDVSRNNLVKIIKKGGVGVELGVFRGDFSACILRNSELSTLHSVDRWAGDRGHNHDEYEIAKLKLNDFKDRSVLRRQTFDQALSDFKKNDIKFDFVYLDGYAHEGQGSEGHFFNWFEMVKSGGLFAGHDYDKAFPKQIYNVDKFFKTTGNPFFLSSEKVYPSWFTFKR